MAGAAERANVSFEAYQRWEYGAQEPRLDSLKMLCDAFEKSPDELGFGHLVKMPQEETNKKQEEAAAPPDQQAIILLSPEQVVALQALLGDDMMAFNQAKRSALANLFKENYQASALVGQPTLLTATLSRRRALASIIGTTAAALGLSQAIGYPQLYPQEALMLCTSSIPLCWSLYFEGGLTETKEHITPYLSQLSTLAQRPTSYQKQAAGLASQAYQLSALLEILFHNLGTALDHAKRLVTFADLTGDANLQTAADIRLAVVYSTLHRPQQRLVAYEHALQHVQETSPLLQARVYAGLMETHSALGNKKAAIQFLERTNNTAPTQYEADPNFSYTHFDPWSIHMYEKDMWINLAHPENAWKTLERSHQIVEQGLTVNRVDLTVKQAETLVMLGDFEQGYDYLTRAVQGARSLGSQLLIEDVYTIYRDMRQKWPQQQVKDLEDLFH